MFLKILGISILFTLSTHAIINPDILIEEREMAAYKVAIKVIKQEIKDTQITIQAKVVTVYRNDIKNSLKIDQTITICYTHKELDPDNGWISTHTAS